MTNTLKVKLIGEGAKAPTRGTSGAAGLDLYVRDVELTRRGTYKYHLGVAVEIPENHVGLLIPRSSVSKTPAVMGNSVGVIDSDYRGEVSAVFRAVNVCGAGMSHYKVGDRCVQLVVVPCVMFDSVEVVEELTTTDRGAGGYGSTGS